MGIAGGFEIKKVEAIIRSDKLGPVIEGLSSIGYPGVTMSEVRGHGKQKGIKHQWRGNEYTVAFIPKTKIELVVLAEDLVKTIDVIVRNGRTGNVGDGKIFVSNIEEAVRVRTGETGFHAI